MIRTTRSEPALARQRERWPAGCPIVTTATDRHTMDPLVDPRKPGPRKMGPWSQWRARLRHVRADAESGIEDDVLWSEDAGPPFADDGPLGDDGPLSDAALHEAAFVGRSTRRSAGQRRFGRCGAGRPKLGGPRAPGIAAGVMRLLRDTPAHSPAAPLRHRSVRRLSRPAAASSAPAGAEPARGQSRPTSNRPCKR